MKKLSAKQELILDYIREFSDEHGYPPSVREICAAVGLRSPSTVHTHLKTLQQKGYILKDDHKTRALCLAGNDKPQPLGVPILGRVTAGLPILAFEEDNGSLAYQPPDNGEYFALKVRGDSMTGAGILDGDFVVVQKNPNPRNGQIVVALLEDEATVKRLQKDPEQVWLVAENPRYEPIDGNSCEILGIVTSVVREHVF